MRLDISRKGRPFNQSIDYVILERMRLPESDIDKRDLVPAMVGLQWGAMYRPKLCRKITKKIMIKRGIYPLWSRWSNCPFARKNHRLSTHACSQWACACAVRDRSWLLIVVPVLVACLFTGSVLCCFQTNLPLAALPLWWWYLYNCASATCRRGMTKRQAASSQLIDNLAALPTAADRRQLNSMQLGSDAARW